MWIAAGLFLAAGLPLFVVSERETARAFAELAAFFLGVFAVLMALDARDSGTLRLQHTVIRRARRPRLFLVLTTGIGLCGVGVIIAAAWAFWLKP